MPRAFRTTPNILKGAKVYDLKGNYKDRKAKPASKTYLDLDFISEIGQPFDYLIFEESEELEEITRWIYEHGVFLQGLNLVDYSLLLEMKKLPSNETPDGADNVLFAKNLMDANFAVRFGPIIDYLQRYTPHKKQEQGFKQKFSRKFEAAIKPASEYRCRFFAFVNHWFRIRVTKGEVWDGDYEEKYVGIMDHFLGVDLKCEGFTVQYVDTHPEYL